MVNSSSLMEPSLPSLAAVPTLRRRVVVVRGVGLTAAAAAAVAVAVSIRRRFAMDVLHISHGCS